MFRAFSGALSLALTLLVLYCILPEVAESLVEVIMKILHIISISLDQALSHLPPP